MLLAEWAIKWGVPPYAMEELKQALGCKAVPLPKPEAAGKSEAWALNELRLQAAHAGVLTFRNNVGVFEDKRGVPVRFGLANESKEQNQRIKSADIIGIRPLLVTPDMIGHTVGVFFSREVKRPGWRYTGVGREAAQKAWVDLVNRAGGDAAFTTGGLL